MRTKTVSKPIIRKSFNEGPLPRLIKEGKLVKKMLRDREIKSPEPYQGPKGTRTQYIRYTDSNGKIMVEFHQYLRPDGTLGAGGKPDPKKLKVGNTLWVVWDHY